MILNQYLCEIIKISKNANYSRLEAFSKQTSCIFSRIIKGHLIVGSMFSIG